jgi:hypothetical protein
VSRLETGKQVPTGREAATLRAYLATLVEENGAGRPSEIFSEVRPPILAGLSAVISKIPEQFLSRTPPCRDLQETAHTRSNGLACVGR